MRWEHKKKRSEVTSPEPVWRQFTPGEAADFLFCLSPRLSSFHPWEASCAAPDLSVFISSFLATSVRLDRIPQLSVTGRERNGLEV